MSSFLQQLYIWAFTVDDSRVHSFLRGLLKFDPKTIILTRLQFFLFL